MNKEIFLSKEQFDQFQSNLQEMLQADLSLNIKSKGKVKYLAARALGFNNHQSISFFNDDSISKNDKTEFEKFWEWASRQLLIHGNNPVTHQLIADRGVPKGFVKVIDLDEQANMSENFGYLPDMDSLNEEPDNSDKVIPDDYEVILVDSPDDSLLKILKKN